MSRFPSIDRRRMLASTGAALATGLCRMPAAAAADTTGQLARYLVGVPRQTLPAEVVEAAKLRILDTLGAIVSGTRLAGGKHAIACVRTIGGTAQATVIGAGLRTTAINAAFANAMSAHGDETDDFDPVTKAHPGCSAVPAALAMADKNGASGLDLIRAVTAGYDVGCRLLKALDADLVRATHRSAEGTSSTFCALGAAAPLARLDETAMRYAISYAAQQVSGLWSWVNDTDHVEKAFDFAGMGARNGVTAVCLAEAGLTGTSNVLDGPNNLLIALSTKPHPDAMVDALGSRFEITGTAIKTFSVGYPNQAALDAILALRRQYTLTPAMVRAIQVKLPPDAIGIVGDSAMPDVNCAHLVAVALLKGTVSFADSHDVALMDNPQVRAIRATVKVSGDPALADPAAPRGALVQVTLADGRTVEHHTRFPSGTRENPLSAEQVAAKAGDLLGPVIGAARTRAVIAQVLALDRLTDARALTALLAT